MGINSKIMDKVVILCKKDLPLRNLVTGLLQLEAERQSHYKDPYKKLIEMFVEEDDSQDSTNSGDKYENI